MNIMKNNFATIAIMMVSFSAFATNSLDIEPGGDVVIGQNLNIQGNLDVAGEIPLPPGFLYGLRTEAGKTSADGSLEPDYCVQINTGQCRSSSNRVNISITDPLTKRIDQSWEPGNYSGGLFAGSLSFDMDRTYHLFLIRNDSDGSIDAGWDTDINALNIPTGYTANRRIRSFVTDNASRLIDVTIITSAPFSTDLYHGHIHKAGTTRKEIYNALAPWLPNIGDKMPLHGFVWNNDRLRVLAERTSDTTITLYGSNGVRGEILMGHTVTSSGGGTEHDGYNVSLSW